MFTRKKKNNKRTEKCKIFGVNKNKAVVHKSGNQGYIRQNGKYILVNRRNNGVWETPRTGFGRILRGA